eukprot:TRINITY_DN7924_c0_g1_i2.p1 TRINITY_DN7924_c0_g1~~TRINITY_DN7924_c0_g1_i2.p1  ORF type:complete len:574 (+),score=115.55 TRINITY_DN7924_c0_g1_i2:51-1772(+)
MSVRAKLLDSTNVQDDSNASPVDIHAGGGADTSYLETNINFLKGNIGAGFLSLPFAFAHGGYVGATVCILIIAGICVHCMHLLVKSKKVLAAQEGLSYMSYADVAAITMGKVGVYLVNFALLITQFGFVLVYILFIADHLNELSAKYSVTSYALMVLPAAIVITWIRDFKTIAPTSIVATLCLLFSFIAIFAFDLSHLGKSVQLDPTCHPHAQAANASTTILSTTAWSTTVYNSTTPVVNTTISSTSVSSTSTTPATTTTFNTTTTTNTNTSTTNTTAITSGSTRQPSSSSSPSPPAPPSSASSSNSSAPITTTEPKQDQRRNAPTSAASAAPPTSTAPAGQCAMSTKPVAWAGIAQLPIFFGNTIFAFESIGLVLPMENNMKDAERFPTVINIGMSIVVTLYVAFGLLGYLVFGDGVEGSITLNLPDTIVFDGVKIALCIALFQSIAIQFFPAIAILERWWMPSVRRNLHTETFQLWAQLGLRSLVICACAGLAIGIPQLGLIIALIGSLGSALLALIFPPIIHNVVMRRELSTSTVYKNYAIIAFGVIGTCRKLLPCLNGLVYAFKVFISV